MTWHVGCTPHHQKTWKVKKNKRIDDSAYGLHAASKNEDNAACGLHTALLSFSHFPYLPTLHWPPPSLLKGLIPGLNPSNSKDQNDFSESLFFA